MNGTPILLAGLSLALASCQPPDRADDSSQATETSPVEGAWRVTAIQEVSADGEVTETPTYESLVLFADGYYSIAFSLGDAPSQFFAERWAATEEESSARFQNIIVNTGTYELTGSSVVTEPLFALVPEFIGGVATYDVSVVGDELTLTAVNIVSDDGVQLPIFVQGGQWVLQLARMR